MAVVRTTIVGGEGILIVMHGGSLETIAPDIPTKSGRSTSGFRRPDRGRRWLFGCCELCGLPATVVSVHHEIASVHLQRVLEIYVVFGCGHKRVARFLHSPKTSVQAV